MSYHIYTTKGIVLSEQPRRESDRIYSILTREFGLIRAMALSARKETSKLRGSLEPFVLSKISLVRGKEYWRITSAESIQSIPAAPTIVRPLILLEKLIQGEAPHPELFDTVESAALCPETDDEMFEIHFVSKILFHLGYLKESDLVSDKKAIIKAINNGLQSSHLT